MTDNANWQSGYKFERIDPNLNEAFIDYLADEFPETAWSTTYVHWHPSVREYCVYINDVWSGYVPEEYIFKAGFEHYKVWSNAWKRDHEVEQTMDLTSHYVKSCIEFCEEKGSVSSVSSDYLEGILNELESQPNKRHIGQGRK